MERISDLKGYEVIARQDRREIQGDDRDGGGVIVFAGQGNVSRATLLCHSERFERSWLLIYCDSGGYLLGICYRPLLSGEVESINSLTDEMRQHSGFVVDIVFVEERNVHQRS